MDRQIIYPSQQPSADHLLLASKFGLTALAKACGGFLGDASTVVTGFAAAPTSPASLTVNIAAGAMYTPAAIDSGAYSTVAADTTVVLKQALSLAVTPLAFTAPATAGQSVNYLVQAAYQEVDTDNKVLPYFNSANPQQPYSGSGNNGLPQPTRRASQVVLSIKAGTAATTGSQTTPPPDAGYIGLHVVTVANGQTTITSGSIVRYANASFVDTTLPFWQQSLINALTAAGITYVPGDATQLLAAINALALAQSAAVVLTDAATIAVDATRKELFKVTLGGNRTLANPTGLVDGQRLAFQIKQDATGSRTLAYGSLFKFPNGIAPVLSTAAGAIDVLSCYYEAGENKIFAVLSKAFA